MHYVDPQMLLFVSAVVMKVCGAILMLAARLARGSLAWQLLYRLFFVSLLLLGIGAAGALVTKSGYGIPLGMTLCLMAVGATIDLGRGGKDLARRGI